MAPADSLTLPEVRGLIGSPAWSELGFQTKEELRQRAYDVNAWPDVEYWFSSSGSTAEPVLYPWTTRDQRVADATVERAHAGIASKLRGTAFVVAPTGLPGMWHHMDRQLQGLGLSTVFPGVESPDRILGLIEKLRPRLVMSLPLVLCRLGELLVRIGAGPNLGGDGVLFAGGDVVSEGRRRRIEAFWGWQLWNFYGLSEVFGPLASEAHDPGVLTWQAKEVFVEILDPVSRQEVQPGQTGVAVLTTLWERPASLLRYWTGDCFRLVEWLAPGRPRFEMRGRQFVRLPGLREEHFPMDVDQVLLSDPAAGNEWTAFRDQGGVVITVETAEGLHGLDPQTLVRVESMFEWPVQWEAVPPGSLDRKVPKLAVTAPESSSS